MRGVRYAVNFAANLEEISEFLISQDVSSAGEHLDSLLTRIDQAAQLIAEFPELGRPATFLEPSQPRLRAAAKTLPRQLKAVGVENLREYSLGAYWILYAIQSQTVVFLAIRSTRQLRYRS